GAGEEFRQRRRADPSHRKPLVGGPRPDEVGRFGDRLIGPLRGGGGGGGGGGGFPDGDYRRRGRGRCRLRRGRGTRIRSGKSGGGARPDGPERGGEGVELGRERFLVAGARAREDVARPPQLGGEGGRAVHGDPRGHRVAPGHRELGHAVGEHAAARVRERAEGGAE